MKLPFPPRIDSLEVQLDDAQRIAVRCGFLELALEIAELRQNQLPALVETMGWVAALPLLEPSGESLDAQACLLAALLQDYGLRDVIVWMHQRELVPQLTYRRVLAQAVLEGVLKEVGAKPTPAQFEELGKALHVWCQSGGRFGKSA